MVKIGLLLVAAAVLAMPVLGAQAEFSGVIRVIDGDTFDVGSTRVRLFGIDAPEQDQTCTSEQGQTWDCGIWVTRRVRALFDGQRATCVQVDRDQYGRSVSRCSVRGADVGETLVDAGLAFAYRRYSMDYDLTEKAAAIRDTGLHASRIQEPSQFRKARNTPEAPVDGSCAIKGNISASGEKIFHRPGQRDYARTSIRTDRGERWFCSAREARTAGWRAARR